MLSIDFETADRITRLNLTEHRDYLQSELDKLYSTMDSDNPYWMHPEDVDKNHMMIRRINEHFTDDTEVGCDRCPAGACCAPCRSAVC